MLCRDCGIELNSYGVCPRCRRYMLPWPPNLQNQNENLTNNPQFNQVRNQAINMNYQQNGNIPAYAQYQQPQQYYGQQNQMIPYQRQYQMMTMQQRSNHMVSPYQYPMIRCGCCNAIIPRNAVVCANCKTITQYGKSVKEYHQNLYFDHTELIKKALLHLFLGLLLGAIFSTSNDNSLYMLFAFFPAGWIFLGKYIGHFYLSGTILFFLIGIVINLGIGAMVGFIILPLEFIMGFMELCSKKRVFPRP